MATNTKDKQDILIKAGLFLASYFLIIRPLLKNFGVFSTQQEKQEEQENQKAQQEQQNLPAIQTNRNFNDLSLNALAKELYDSADRFAYDYPIIMRSYAYFAGFRHTDAIYFLKVFAQRNGITLYRWYVEKFQNSTNFVSVYNHKNLLDKYEKNYKKFGYTPSLFGDQSPDLLSEKAVSYVYLVASVKKG